MTTRVISQFHDTPEASHPGRDETIRQIARTYAWKGRNAQVSRYVNSCIVCRSVKARQPQPTAPLKAHSPRGPFETVSLDILGPYAKSREGNRYVILVEDVFSKWVEARAVPDVTGQTVVNFLETEVVSRYGYPRCLVSDNGGHFRSGPYTQWCLRNQVQIFYTAVYHQRANPTERRVQELKKVLRSLTIGKAPNTWDRYLPKALFVLRNRRNAATGQTPAYIVLGHEPPRQGEWQVLPYTRERRRHEEIPRAERVQRALDAQTQYQQGYAPADALPPVTFRLNDAVMAKVLRKNQAYFLPVWTGPHLVVAKPSEEVYTIDRNGQRVDFHVDDLRPAPTQQEETPVLSDSEPDSSDDDDDDQAQTSPAMDSAEATSSPEPQPEEGRSGSTEPSLYPHVSPQTPDKLQTPNIRSSSVPGQGTTSPPLLPNPDTPSQTSARDTDEATPATSVQQDAADPIPSLDGSQQTTPATSAPDPAAVQQDQSPAVPTRKRWRRSRLIISRMERRSTPD